MMQNTTSPAGIAGQKVINVDGDMLLSMNKCSDFEADRQVMKGLFDLENAPNNITDEEPNDKGDVLTLNKEFYTASELLNMGITEIPMLVDGLIHKVGLAAIAGSSDTGKSTFLRNLCLNVCAGNDEFLGFKLNTEHKSAIYVSTEDDGYATAISPKKQNKRLGISPEKADNLRFVFDSYNLISKLEAMLSDKRADIIVIDAFSDIYDGGINDVNQVRCFLDTYYRLANKYKCLVMFLHHCGKHTDDKIPSKHNLIGSQGFEGKMRLVLELRNDLADTNYKHLCCVKGNYLPADSKNESYKLKFTEDLTFEYTGERVPFGHLKKNDDDDSDRQKYELVKQLQTDGKSTREIAEIIGYKSAGSVSKLIQRMETKESA
ncbi:AAA family ATPase [Dysgonomonas sp. Marseille-P4361]|uniref:AAA family ATPase n=1 Tax=Dysgonomonas sp. Marseille-P4361 TaxID=2161820 RepID=UPI000D55E18D|nr:AAA family ATPase [Dysgonomonas sp. Marseille-P4361]